MMNQEIQTTAIKQSIEQASEKFKAIIAENPDIKVKWQTESMFAWQQITKNDYIRKAAENHPASLRNAIINIASIGLSLNPANGYAYLVPRDGVICLDVSYKGLIKIATDTGSIQWARADVVYETDKFTYKGPAREPDIECNPFLKDRGEVIGAYCIAKTYEGDILTDVMSIDELNDIKAKSSSVKGNGAAYSPWNTFPNEMRKKAVIKRSSKTWPKTERHEHLDKVIEYVNNEEGIDFRAPDEEDIKLYSDLIHQKNGVALRNLMDDDWEYWAKVESTFYEKGKKVKFRAMLKEWMDEAENYVSSVMVNMLENQDNTEIAMECYNEMNDEEQKLFWKRIQPDTRIIVENIISEAESNE